MKGKAVNLGDEPKDFNYGLALLRIWMCFEVVLCHFMDWNCFGYDTFTLMMKILFSYSGIAVPVFMLLSFLLTDMDVLAHDNLKIRHRFYRLLVPHLFWAVEWSFI